MSPLIVAEGALLFPENNAASKRLPNVAPSHAVSNYADKADMVLLRGRGI
jgi:hypothetical protein